MTRKELEYPNNNSLPTLRWIMDNIPIEEIERELSADTREMIEHIHNPNPQRYCRNLNLRLKNNGQILMLGLKKGGLYLYKEQWLKLALVMDEIVTFIKINDKYIPTKYKMIQYDIEDKNEKI